MYFDSVPGLKIKLLKICSRGEILKSLQPTITALKQGTLSVLVTEDVHQKS